MTPQAIAHQAPLSMGFSRQEYWSGLPFPSPKCPQIAEWINKMQYRHTMEYYSALRKETLPFVTTWMNMENIILDEIRQLQDIYCIILLV